MKRKMLDEEKALRKAIRDSMEDIAAMPLTPEFNKFIEEKVTALVRACYEDAAKVAEYAKYSPSDVRSDKYNAGCDRAAAAIRAK